MVCLAYPAQFIHTPMEYEEYEHQGPLDEAAFRKWAYDWNMILMSQDEDLIIGTPRDYDIWFDILKDTDCPKFDYIIGCIDYHLKYYILNRLDEEAVKGTNDALKYCKEIDHQQIRFLEERLKLRLNTSQRRGLINKEQAISMGRVLLMCKNQIMEEIVLISSNPMSWIVGQQSSTLRLKVNRLTGSFKLVD